MSVNSLGDVFPEEWKKKLAEENFKIGAVFKFYCEIAAKEKRMILAGFKYNKTSVALVHINSEINEKFFPTPQLKQEHCLLEYSDNKSYLDKDSYVNCSQLIIKDSKEIFEMLCNQPSIHLGQMLEVDFKMVRDKIVDSKVIRKDSKKDYGLFEK